MIIEPALLSITPGREAEFEAAFESAPAIFGRAEGCHGVELRRGVENPSDHLLLVRWETVDHHVVGFRESPPPTVQHFDTPVGGQ